MTDKNLLFVHLLNNDPSLALPFSLIIIRIIIVVVISSSNIQGTV